MNSSASSPPVRAVLPAAALFMLLGWGGLALLITLTEPDGGTRWLFFFFWVLALTGTLLPATAYLNRRFPATPPVTPLIVLRQALWFGILGPTLMWFDITNVTTPALVALLLVSVVLIEFLLRMSERSHWRPGRN